MNGKVGLEPRVIVPVALTPELLTQAGLWPDRFRSKVAIRDGCWEWTAGKANGYGRYAVRKKYLGGPSIVANAHRYGWQVINGEIPKGYHVDHLCRNHSCVRPDHLEPVPPRINAQRGRQANVAGLCRAGVHPWTEENILRDGETSRCRPCRTEKELAYRPPKGTAHGDKTHCPAGHPYNELNTRHHANGSRDCRVCHRIRERIKYRTKRGLPILEEHYAA